MLDLHHTEGIATHSLFDMEDVDTPDSRYIDVVGDGEGYESVGLQEVL